VAKLRSPFAWCAALLALGALASCRRAARDDTCGTAEVERLRYQQSSQACEGGDLRACLTEAALLEVGGYWVPKAPELAAKLRQRACEGGVGCAGDAGLLSGGLQPDAGAEPDEGVVVEATRLPGMDLVHTHPDLVPRLECSTNEVKFSDRAAALLDDVAATLRAHPQLVLLLEGTATPDERSAIKLAQSRADAAAAQLAKRGVDPQRLVARALVQAGPRGVRFSAQPAAWASVPRELADQLVGCWAGGAERWIFSRNDGELTVVRQVEGGGDYARRARLPQKARFNAASQTVAFPGAGPIHALLFMAKRAGDKLEVDAASSRGPEAPYRLTGSHLTLERCRPNGIE
jgi:hypothetical protein